MKISELTDLTQIDALVAMAQGWVLDNDMWKRNSNNLVNPKYIVCEMKNYTPSSGNAQTYELIEKFKIEFSQEHYCDEDTGELVYSGIHEAEVLLSQGWRTFTGSTPAEAICKAVIAAKWGDELPDDIWRMVA